MKIPEDHHKRFWIIDGQHRISGLGHSSCAQKNNYIPFVLLHGDDYTGPDFAEIFAMVTTKADPFAGFTQRVAAICI